MKKQYGDTEIDSQLEKLNSDFLWRQTKKQELKKRILTDIEGLESKDRYKITNVSIHNKRVSLIKKLAYSSIAMTVLFGLFIGSAFFSPVMAEVVSKIPFLNQVFQTQPVTTTIADKLQNEGYKIGGISTRDKQIEIRVSGSEEYFQGIQKEVEEIALEILKSRKYDAYTVKVVKDNHTDVKPSRKTLMQIEESEKISKSLKQALNISDDYFIQVTPKSDEELLIYIEIPNTENNVEAIKEIAQKVIEENTDKKYKIEFLKIDMNKREQENRWFRITIPMFEGLSSKKEFQVQDYSLSSKSQRMTLYIETTIPSSNPNSKQLGTKIENTIVEFLESEEIREIIKDDEYQIIVYSKDKQKIN